MGKYTWGRAEKNIGFDGEAVFRIPPFAAYLVFQTEFEKTVQSNGY